MNYIAYNGKTVKKINDDNEENLINFVTKYLLLESHKVVGIRFLNKDKTNDILKKVEDYCKVQRDEKYKEIKVGNCYLVVVSDDISYQPRLDMFITDDLVHPENY